jgi:hypothetical protein
MNGALLGSLDQVTLFPGQIEQAVIERFTSKTAWL